MQDKLMQAQAQPFVKLAQSNMDLLSRFSASPEVTKQASANASLLFQQASESTMKLMQSAAFSHLMPLLSG
jgi:maltose-binding protein MalE